MAKQIIVTKNAKGQIVRLLRSVADIDAGHSESPNATIKGMGSITTESGRMTVNAQGDGRYMVVQTGEVLTEVLKVS